MKPISEPTPQPTQAGDIQQEVPKVGEMPQPIEQELKLKSSTDENLLLYGKYGLRNLLTGFETMDGKSGLDVLEDALAQAIKQERSRVVKEMKLGMLGIITSVSYSMKLSNGQVTVLNRQINDLLDTLNNSA